MNESYLTSSQLSAIKISIENSQAFYYRIQVCDLLHYCGITSTSALSLCSEWAPIQTMQLYCAWTWCKMQSSKKDLIIMWRNLPIMCLATASAARSFFHCISPNSGVVPLVRILGAIFESIILLYRVLWTMIQLTVIKCSATPIRGVKQLKMFFFSSPISNREVAHTSHEYISWNKNKIYADITMSRIINKFTTLFVILIINSQLIRFCALFHIFCRSRRLIDSLRSAAISTRVTHRIRNSRVNASMMGFLS